MEIQVIDERTFDKYAKTHILKSFYQTSAYGEVMRKCGYTPMYVAGYENGEIKAASLILTKKLGAALKYGYAPRGFLLNYYDNELFENFTKALRDFLSKKAFVFVKVNPEITLAAINAKNKERKLYKRNSALVYLFQELDYYKLRDNIYFESLLPRFNPVLQLPSFTLAKIDAEYRKTVEKNLNRGLKLVKGTEDDFKIFDSLIKKRKPLLRESYWHFYTTFSDRNMIELLLLELDLKDYLEYLTSEYETEKAKNVATNAKFQNSPNSIPYYSVKMASDMRLNDLHSEISMLNKKVEGGIEKEFIGAALIVKYEGRINVLETGTDPNFEFLEPKHFLFYKLITEYKKRGYSFFDMNGITGDFSERNPYYGLNKFKESFNPSIYEYIGEFDLIVNKALYQYLISSNKLAKEFDKSQDKPVVL